MNRKYPILILVLLLGISLLISPAAMVKAQAPVPTPIPAVTQQAIALPSDPNVVMFNMLGQGDTQLVGPLDGRSFTFTLPADWSLSGNAQINLLMAVSFNTSNQNQLTPTAPTNTPLAVVGGTLTVLLNNISLGVLQLNQVGETVGTLQIPTKALIPIRNDGRMVLNMLFDGRYACFTNQNMTVIIHSTSNFILPHNSIPLSTSLVNFPRPIYQGTFVPDSALLIIPDQPTTSELQEAMIVAAGLGNLSGNKLALDITTVGKLTPTLVSANHLIFIGKASSLQPLGQLQLPVPASGGQFNIAGGGPADGVIQMIDSPWSATHVVLVVSGNTDQGVLKAAQAIGTGVFLPNNFANVSVIQNIQVAPTVAQQPVDLKLTDLGYSGRLFNTFGVDTVPYIFNIPPGFTVTSDAHFDLVFGNSALLNYNRSGIVVALNGLPIGSVRLSDTTAAQPTNKTVIPIPASAIVPGSNLLEIKANLIPIDDCTPPNLHGLWVQIWPDSLFHLPLAQALLNPVANLNLGSFPAPYIYDPALGQTAFVLPHDDLNSWHLALQIAALMGQRANVSISALTVYYNDQIPQAERSKYNLLVIGQPSLSPIIKELNNSLPVPFSGNSDIPSVSNTAVSFRISPASPIGFLEMMPSPWNSNNIVLAVLGNTSQGIAWAATALIDPTLRSNLGGNFGLVNDRQIITSDTRVATLTTTGVSTTQPEVVVIPPNGIQATPPAARPTWILPALFIFIVLLVLLILTVPLGNRLRDYFKNRNKVK